MQSIQRFAAGLRVAVWLLASSVSLFGVRGAVVKIAKITVDPKRALRVIRMHLGPRQHRPADKRYLQDVPRPAPELQRPRVLIAGILEVPQCAKYRIWQKQAYFQSLGLDCTVIHWSDIDRVRDALQTHSMVVFYRVPGVPSALDLIAEAKRLNVPTFWEVDDLIFDREAYGANTNLQYIDRRTRLNVLAGVSLYREAMLACGRAIASTPVLAAAIKQAGIADVHVIENALDQDTLDCAQAVRARRARMAPKDDVTIIYGSGTNTHSADFRCAADGLLAVLRARPRVRLRIVGPMLLPEEFAAFGDRVERMPMLDFRGYLGLLGDADISIAPLQPSLFNDAKSNIKFLEAAILGIPSVSSPRAHFRQIVDDGRNGFFADTPQDWERALIALADDADLRRRMGEAARKSVTDRYNPDRVARGEVAPLLDTIFGPGSFGDKVPARIRTKPPLRVLIANVHFAPQSYGGATVVAEQLAHHLSARPDTEVSVLTTWGDEAALPYRLVRYAVDDLTVYAVKLPRREPGPLLVTDYDDREFASVFADVLRAARPDVVHLHSIQGLGIALAAACRDAGIPYVVTLHDAWWLCERQFMVREDVVACGQTRIDWGVCRTCVKDLSYSIERTRALRATLDQAALLLAPSQWFADLYLANGFDPSRMAVNPNGVPKPALSVAKPAARPLRFGLAATGSPIKGTWVVRAAFEALGRDDYELVLVDDRANLGFPPLPRREWRFGGKVTIIPGFHHTQSDAFFSRIDVYLAVTQMKESFGLLIHEALLRDKWIITTDCGAPMEDVIDGVNADVLPLGPDHRPLVAAITALLDNPERLDGYINPRKPQTLTSAQQAEQLLGFLVAAAGERTPRVLKPAS